MRTRTGIAVAAAGVVFYLDAPRAEAPPQVVQSARNRYLVWY
jgi:hypothetical protein